MGFKFNKEVAVKTDINSFISETGIYNGVILSAIEKTYESGAESISFSFKDKDGKTAKYMDIFTVKKDRTAAFGANQIQSLMGILQVVNADPVYHDNGDSNYDCFCNRPIALALQRVNTPNQKYPFKMRILHFLDGTTFQTYKEKTNGIEAKVFKAKIDDGMDTSGNYKAAPSSLPGQHSDDDCPF